MPKWHSGWTLSAACWNCLCDRFCLVVQVNSTDMEAFLKGSSSTGAASAQQSAAKKKKRAERVLPWVEKYRPKTVQEISYQDEIVAVLSKILEGADLPNLLFYGPPGTGKTSAMLAAARQMFGSDLYRDRVLELNASDERGIQVVREKIKRFAQFSASGVRPNGTSCPPLKIIILDEADAMTTAAQAALRRTMEREAKTTRFCLICNYISRIIDPLTSRCAKFRFKPLSEEIQLKRLMFVCDQENLKISQSALKSLIGACEGDLRKSMTFLQSASSFKSGQEINDEDVAEITGVVSTPVLMGFLNVAKSGSFERLQLCIKNLILDGYPAYQLLTQLFDLIMEQADLPDKQKAAVCEKMAVCDKRLLDGADEFVQLLDLGCTLLMQYKSI